MSVDTYRTERSLSARLGRSESARGSRWDIISLAISRAFVDIREACVTPGVHIRRTIEFVACKMIASDESLSAIRLVARIEPLLLGRPGCPSLLRFCVRTIGETATGGLCAGSLQGFRTERRKGSIVVRI